MQVYIRITKKKKAVPKIVLYGNRFFEKYPKFKIFAILYKCILYVEIIGSFFNIMKLYCLCN